MVDRPVMASEFKARCLKILDAVAQTRESYVITKRGRPLARLVPLESADEHPLMGSVTLLADDDDAYLSSGEPWDAADDPSRVLDP